jgi:polar amino acid transport system permease protein
VKLTTLGSVLAVYELLHSSNNLITETYRPLEIYSILAVIFAVIIYPVIFLSRRLEGYWVSRS